MRLSPAAARVRWWWSWWWPIELFPWEAGERVPTLAPALSQLGAFKGRQGPAGERTGWGWF